MRHRVAYRKLGRVTEHRIAMLRNQATTLITKGRIETTVARAKELRPFTERLITIAKRSLAKGTEGVHAVNARRAVAQDIVNKDAVRVLFETVAPRYADRNGGYTRLLRLGFRRGDAAETAMVELIGSEYDPNAQAKTDAAADAPKKKSVGERLRGALGGGKKPAGGGDRPKVQKAAKGARKVSTPRKAGGGS